MEETGWISWGGISVSKRYEERFKEQIANLFNNGKSLADINKEYGIAKSTVKTWVERLNNSG